MNSGRTICAVLLAIGVGLAAPAAALASTMVVIRGATADPVKSSGSGDDPSGVTVLRGPPLPTATPYACPGGYAPEPGYGCVAPGAPYEGFAYQPYDFYGYWPYDYYGYWPYFGFVVTRHRAFHHGFVGRFARGPRVGLAPGFAVSHGAFGLARGFGGLGRR